MYENQRTFYSEDVQSQIRTITCRSRIAFPWGAVKLVKKMEVQGANPLAGVQGAEPPSLGKFCISELISRDLVHTLYFLPTLY